MAKKCSFCGSGLGSTYWIRWKNYLCRDCNDLEAEFRAHILESMPNDLEEVGPIDNRYQFGIIAITEARARAIVEQCYFHTPSRDDLEC